MSDGIVNNGNGITDKLLGDLTAANSEAKKYRLAKRQAQQELDALRVEHAQLRKELETLRATPNQLQDELTALRSEVRNGVHKHHFAKLAKELKVKDEALEDLWSLSQYHADTDLPDLDKMRTTIQETVKSRPYFVGAEAPTNGYTPGPGLSRGNLNEGVAFTVRRSDAGNPEWLRINSAKMAAAATDGSLRWLD